MVDVAHLARTRDQFVFLTSKLLQIVDSWEEPQCYQWMRDTVLGKFGDFWYGATGVPGTIASNNVLESWNERAKSHNLLRGTSQPTPDVVYESLAQLVHAEGENGGCHLRFAREPVRRMPAHVQMAATWLQQAETKYWIRDDEETRTVLYVDAPYELSVGRRQRLRMKKRNVSCCGVCVSACLTAVGLLRGLFSQ
eukprot:GHVU01088076.1.p2 GENE.GHVU01088076.1~~GHVU01088076.1.p2  ORF type:complete len:195 (+),score=21.25 GHVU01088076.1:775-1359(+)